MEIRKVMIAGSGVLGSQIALQVASHGFNTIIYDISEDALEKAKKSIDGLKVAYERDLGTTDAEWERSLSLLAYTTDLEKAAQVDLVIESIPEVPEIKMEFYEKVGKIAPEHAIFVTNSSTLLPSMFAESTGRPTQFLGFHFANNIWTNNTVEVMNHAGTENKYFEIMMEFGKAIGMVSLPILKEQPGYILNSLLVPLLISAVKLYGDGVSDPYTIDKTWVLGAKAPRGPFAIMDVIGLTTVYHITSNVAKQTQDPVLEAVVEKIKLEFIDQGKLGVATGEGFYKYPNPAYMEEDFYK